MELIYKSWAEMPITIWQELNAIQSDNDWTKLIERAALLYDCDPEDLRKLKPGEFSPLVKQMEFINSPLDPPVETRFELRGVRYGMIPQLDFISMGEWVDSENWKDKPIENLHFLCAMLWRPITWEDDTNWKIEEHKAEGFIQRANLFLKELPIEKVLGGVVFFSAFGMEFIKIMKDYSLVEQPKVEKQKVKKAQSVGKKRGH